MSTYTCCKLRIFQIEDEAEQLKPRCSTSPNQKRARRRKTRDLSFLNSTSLVSATSPS